MFLEVVLHLWSNQVLARNWFLLQWMLGIPVFDDIPSPHPSALHVEQSETKNRQFKKTMQSTKEIIHGKKTLLQCMCFNCSGFHKTNKISILEVIKLSMEQNCQTIHLKFSLKKQKNKKKLQTHKQNTTTKTQHQKTYVQGPVVQSIISLMSLLMGQNVNCSSKYNI